MAGKLLIYIQSGKRRFLVMDKVSIKGNVYITRAGSNNGGRP